MPDYFNQGFSVRKPMWHGMGEILAEYPGRDEGMALAGHNFTVVERPFVVVGSELTDLPEQTDDFVRIAGNYREATRAKGWKALLKDMPGDETHGVLLNVVKDSYTVIQNDIGWDIVDAIVGEGAKYETGLTLKDGAVCCVLAWLDEPTVIPGDDTTILPWVNVAWTHDGSGAATARATSIRTVCWNTQSAAEAQGQRLGTDFTFRHTKNVMERIEDAKMALKGIRAGHEEYLELARELAGTPVTANQRELFVTQFLPMPPEALISERVIGNVEAARTKLRNLFDGPTIPEAHRLTAYGLHLAGGEYLDHVRAYRTGESYFGRSMLRPEPAKAKMGHLIREVVEA